MSSTSESIEPVYSDSEREELGHLAYLVVRLDELCQRGLLTSEACAAVAAESRGRRAEIEYKGTIERARRLAKKNRNQALESAERARELDPSRVDAWNLIVALNWDLGNDADAIARCCEAAQRFPELQSEVDRLKAEQAKRDHERSPRG